MNTKSRAFKLAVKIVAAVLAVLMIGAAVAGAVMIVMQ